MESIAAIDADVICYQACAYCETKEAVQWGDEAEYETPELSDAVRMAKDMIDMWREAAGCTGVVLAWSGPSHLNFRRKVWSGYKEHRVGDKPEHYADVRTALTAEYDSYEHDVLEGDDTLGLLLTAGVADVVISTDKDIRTLPGRILRVPFRSEDPYVVVDNSEQEADRYWMYQTICGDSSDGYKGCPGAGPKTARDALVKCTTLSEMWAAVLDVYEQFSVHKRWGSKFEGLTPRTLALRNARMARILRVGDFNAETGEVKLWNP